MPPRSKDAARRRRYFVAYESCAKRPYLACDNTLMARTLICAQRVRRRYQERGATQITPRCRVALFIVCACCARARALLCHYRVNYLHYNVLPRASALFMPRFDARAIYARFCAPDVDADARRYARVYRHARAFLRVSRHAAISPPLLRDICLLL